MSRATRIGRHHPEIRAAQSLTKHLGPQGWSRTHRQAARVLGTTFLMAVAAGCTAQPTEQSDVEPVPTSAVGVPLLEEQPDLVALAPGRYVFNPYDSPSSAPLVPVLQVPPGYLHGGVGLLASDGYRFMGLWDIESVYTHPCDHDTVLERVGPSVADLAGALAAQPMREGTDPVPVTIGGYDGLYVELSTPEDVTACLDGAFRSWPGRGDTTPGMTDLIWIVDVDGQRITFDLAYGPGTTPEQVDELKEIVTTATFALREGA